MERLFQSQKRNITGDKRDREEVGRHNLWLGTCQYARHLPFLFSGLAWIDLARE